MQYFQMNFRGSVGYGRKFWEISFKQWGKTMQDDITDGVNWLIDNEIADAERISIYGASYGGYATFSRINIYTRIYIHVVLIMLEFQIYLRYLKHYHHIGN